MSGETSMWDAAKQLVVTVGGLLHLVIVGCFGLCGHDLRSPDKENPPPPVPPPPPPPTPPAAQTRKIQPEAAQTTNLSSSTSSNQIQQWLEEGSGKKCLMLSAKMLEIPPWGNDPRYWQWSPDYPNSRFAEVAKLKEVWWLEIRGLIKTSMLSPNTTYVVSLIFKLTSAAEGFGYPFQEATVKVGGFASSEKLVCIQYPPPPSYLLDDVDEVPHPHNSINNSTGGWLELVLGDFYISEDSVVNDQVQAVNVRLFAKDETEHRKVGLIVEGMEFKPKKSNSSVDVI